jgi:hypothetical protein
LAATDYRGKGIPQEYRMLSSLVYVGGKGEILFLLRKYNNLMLVGSK